VGSKANESPNLYFDRYFSTKKRQFFRMIKTFIVGFSIHDNNGKYILYKSWYFEEILHKEFIGIDVSTA
jgi:hypothetical protein